MNAIAIISYTCHLSQNIWWKIREGRFAVYVLHVLLHEGEPSL